MATQARSGVLPYVLLVALLVVTFGLGLKGLGLARPLFIAGCLGVAWSAWRISPGRHIEVVITLFAFAPFLRRVVDSHAGYNASGVMLVGPLLALCVALPELRKLVRRQRNFGTYLPYGIMITCLTYGWAISAFQNNVAAAGAEAVKTLVPMLYAIYLMQREDDGEEIIQGAARAFLVIGPIIGVYGVLQYLNPPEWDRYWMIYSQMKSIGMPEPRQVRVFSTMNSPTSFACYAACGVLLFGFCRRGWLPILLTMPIGIALLLSSVRTAWITCAIGVAYCFFFSATRKRAMVLALSLAGVAAVALLLTPFGDMIGNRLATLGGDPAEDGSGHARVAEYVHVYSSLDQYLFGAGLASDAKDPKLKNIDGQFLVCAVQMGIFIGNIYVMALVWAGVQGLVKIQPDTPPLRLVAASVVLGYLLVLPLLLVTTGEIGFLFWLCVGVLPTMLAPRADARSWGSGGSVPPRLLPSGLAVTPPHARAGLGGAQAASPGIVSQA